MFIHRILELPWFIFIFAHHITINFFENILCIHSGVIFGTNCNILILTLFSSVFPMSLTFICCTSALQHLKPYLWVQPFGGLNATANWLQIVFVWFSTSSFCFCCLLHPAVIPCGIMFKINYKLVVVFEKYLLLLLDDVQDIDVLFLEAETHFSLKILSFKGHIKFQTYFSAS